jgi:hypothetical protein
MVGNEFDRGGSCDDSFDGFDVVVWCDQVDSGEGRIVVRLYVFFSLRSSWRVSCGHPLCDVLDGEEVTGLYAPVG